MITHPHPLKNRTCPLAEHTAQAELYPKVQMLSA